MYTRDRRDTTEKKIIKSKKNYYGSFKREVVLLKRAQKKCPDRMPGPHEKD
ncbi:MAG: hypothetical protein JEZ12_24825 [Desulfobacterium sp.]|nr:hypothetical protein [Desulfobacterium sp.]